MKPIHLQILDQLKTERAQRNEDIGISKRFPNDWKSFFSMLKAPSGDKIVNLECYPYQEEVVRLVETYRNTVVLKSRQLGISLIIISWILFNALKNPAYKALVFSKTQKDSSKLGKRTRDLLYSLGKLAPELTSDSMFKIEIQGGGTIEFLSSSVKDARGADSVHTIFYDEAAFIDNFGDIKQAAGPSQQVTGDAARTIYASTPGGADGDFYNLCAPFLEEMDLKEIIRNNRTQEYLGKLVKGNTALALVHWMMHPLFSKDPKKFVETTKKELELTDEAFDQEFNLDFSVLGSTFFDPNVVDARAILNIQEYPFYEEFIIGGIDTAWTVGGDNFSLTIAGLTESSLNCKDYYYKNDQNLQGHIQGIYPYLDKWKPLVVSVENNGGNGDTVIEQLQAYFPETTFISFNMNQTLKIRLTDKMNYLLQTGFLNLISGSPHIQDLKKFVNLGNVRRAASGFHDDGVMSLAALVHASYQPMQKQQNLSVSYDELLENYMEDIYQTF